MKLRVSFCFSPDEKIPVGTLMDSGRDVAFEYDRGFAATGLQPAPFRLPVREGASVFDHSGGMEVFGVSEDSLPDGWGRRLVDRSFRRKFGRAPSVLERLACVGLNGMGALVYEPDMEIESPQDEFDFTFAAGPNGWHTLSVAGEGADPKEDDLRRLAESVGIADEVAHEEYVRIVDVCGDLPRLI